MRHLYPSQAEAQRAILRSIARGYPLYTTGLVRVDKWDRLVAKFRRLYEVDISPAARQNRKRRGRCAALLIGAELPPDDRGDMIRWVLLVTEAGIGPVKDEETLRDARSERMTWGDYVCMYLTRPRQHGGGARWTWCLTREAERACANYLTELAQAAGRNGDPRRLHAFVDTLLRRPMHSGVRTQVAKMLRRAEKVWSKHSGGLAWPCIEPDALPQFGRYTAPPAAA